MKKMFFINLIMALLIILAFSVNIGGPVTATASDSYFVSTAGSDRNPGTEEKPWATIQKAAESAMPGSTVYIKAGTYYERVNIKVSGTSVEQPVIFQNYNNDRVIIDGSKSYASEQADMIRISNQSFVKIIGLEIIGNSSEGKDSLITGIGVWGMGEGIEIRDCKINHIWYTGTSKKAGAQAIGVYGKNTDEPISGLVIDGNEIWDIRCGSSEAVTLSGNVDGFSFTHNYVHDTNNTGLALISARNGFVGYNTMERNSSATNPVYLKDDFSAGGICANGALDTVIAYNTCNRNDIGIIAVNENSGNVISEITVRENLIFENNASGILAGGKNVKSNWLKNCQFRNNTLYNNDIKNLGMGEINIAKGSNLTFSSNIVYTGAQNLAVKTEAFGGNSVMNVNFDHNIYYGPGGSRGLRFTGTDTGLVGLNMWKFKTKQDSSSKIADPKFADPAKSDFRLLQFSPAIDFGDPAYIPADSQSDFAGALRRSGKTVDCGAYEF